MKKKVLIIGFGSIGKRHASILSQFKNIGKIFILTKQKSHGYNKITNLSEIKLIDPDYILICSRTSDHYKHLQFIEKNLKNKIILVEKPLFKNSKNFKIKKNKVFVGYNFRYHPIIKYIKNFIKNKRIFSVSANCKSYLPHWRKNIKYSKSNSAKKCFGGGVLLELSHEIDYIQWIFKKIKKIEHVRMKRISNLKIDTEDCVTIIGKTLVTNFIIDLNFFSLNSERVIIVDGKDFTLKADLIKNFVQIFGKRKKNIKFNIKKDFTYEQQHKSLLKGNYDKSCTYSQGEKLMLLIDRVKKNYK